MPKKPPKLINAELHVPIYELYIRLLVGPHDQASKWMHENLGETDFWNVPGSTTRYRVPSSETPLQQLVLYVQDPQDLSTMVHECVHAANAVLNIVQVETSQDNDEALAYLTAYIFGSIMEEVHA